jgi:dTDP-4-amino-4,6-dideoxygalactose transaminase
VTIRKQTTDDLAMFGGQPAFEKPLHVGQPNVGDRKRLLERINNILDQRWFTNNGPLVQEFEHRVADLVGVKHCIAMCNATVAMEITIRALELTGEVIIPSMTFIATAHALQWQEITPVFCDIDPATHNIDPVVVERMITPRTTGLIGVHLWGRPCDTSALEALAQSHNLKVIYDAAHAFGCSHHGLMIGRFGEAEIFSFHATKFVNTFEGGAVVTDDDELAAKIRLMKNFGFAGYDNVIYIGMNGKMTEISAAMGLTELESLDTYIQTNRRNYQQYRDEIADLPGIRMVTYNEDEQHNYQYIVVEIDSDEADLSRDRLVDILHRENALVRRYFYPGCHRMEPYRSYFPHAGLMLPETEALVERVLLLPTGTGVTTDQIGTVCQIIRTAIQNAKEIKKQWPDD